MKIQVTVWCNGYGQESREEVTITAEDICQLAEERTREEYQGDVKVEASKESMAIIDL